MKLDTTHGYSIDLEKKWMAQILGHIHEVNSSPTGGPRVVIDTLRGTPSAMQTQKDKLNKAMQTIKENMIDIAHSSHNIDYPNQAEKTDSQMAWKQNLKWCLERRWWDDKR